MKAFVVLLVCMISFALCEALLDSCTCENGGVCNTSGICQCTEKYTGTRCETERKHKKTAILLSVLAGGWGADRFYLGYPGAGAAKLILSLLPCFGVCFSLCLFRSKERLGIAGIVLSVLTYFILVLWWMTDWVLIVRDQLNDSDGFTLY